MDTFDIVRCRVCGALMKRYRMCVYPGDASCCTGCNEKAGKNEAGQRRGAQYSGLGTLRYNK